MPFSVLFCKIHVHIQIHIHMVAIRSREIRHYCISSRKIPKWLIVVGLGFTVMVLNATMHQQPFDVKSYGTSTTKLDAIFPTPDGAKDHNLMKGTTTSFNAFSFYLMGDTPVSSRLFCTTIPCNFECSWVIVVLVLVFLVVLIVVLIVMN